MEEEEQEEQKEETEDAFLSSNFRGEGRKRNVEKVSLPPPSVAGWVIITPAPAGGKVCSESTMMVSSSQQEQQGALVIRKVQCTWPLLALRVLFSNFPIEEGRKFFFNAMPSVDDDVHVLHQTLLPSHRKRKRSSNKITGKLCK